MPTGINPRSVRIAGLIRRVVAEAIEHELHDRRLRGITITEVRVTNDMQLARIFWTQLAGSDKERGERKRAQQALKQASGRLRSLVGAKAGLRLTPVLEFRYDEVPTSATSIEDTLALALKRDRDLARLRENAQYAGDADPYRRDEDAEETDTEESEVDVEETFSESLNDSADIVEFDNE